MFAGVFAAVFMLTTTGCSTEDFNNWINGDYLGIDSSIRDSGTQPQANTQGYLLSAFDIKSVTDDVLDALPEYDFSGPSNYTDGLNADEITVSDKEVDNTNKVSIYLVPAYVGTKVSPMLPKTSVVKKKIEKVAKSDPDMSVSNVWTELFKVYTGRETNEAYKRLYKDNRDNLIPANNIGLSNKAGTRTYYEYVFDWQMCKLVGNKLSNKGYNVYFSHEGGYENGYKLNTFDVSGQGWDSICKDVKEKLPHAVLIIGFNPDGADKSLPSSKSGTYVGCVNGAHNLAESIVKRYAEASAKIEMPLQGTAVSDSVKSIDAGYASLLSGCEAPTVQVFLGGFAANLLEQPADKRYDNKKFQSAIADAIALGAIDYLESSLLPDN